MKNEALRLMLAVTALILTALLTNPMSISNEQDISQDKIAVHETQVPEKKVNRKVASDKNKKSKATRSFAFFFHR